METLPRAYDFHRTASPPTCPSWCPHYDERSQCFECQLDEVIEAERAAQAEERADEERQNA